MQDGENEGARFACLPSLERSCGRAADHGQFDRGRAGTWIGEDHAGYKNGQPVARSTLRKALLAVRQASGMMFDVDACIVDQRTMQPR